ncbi:MAG TPA: Hpt domain-containing protein, partial [Rudaea sp.]|nr:Hpt domain-containing protein [Rudaea sp.]
MKLQEDIDFTTLNWVKQELDETLNQARQALEAYVDDPADTSLMRFCATYLHQVQGTLRMVELYGAAMVVDEMERVAQGLLDGSVKPQDDTYSVLMRGIVQLPDYLERLQSGHKDIPIVLLPLLNDLRATRGEKLLTESALFSPDLSATLPAAAAGAAVGLPVIELRAQGARLRTAFQLSLLRWIRDDSAADQLDRLIDVLDRVRKLCAGEEARRLWWVAAGVLESVRSGSLETSAAVKLLFGKIDRQIKRLVDGGESEFAADPPRELTKNLLYYVAHSTAAGPRAAEIAQLYRLDSLLPTEREVEHAKGSISGHNRALLDTVSTAIKDDLLRVKEALDIFLRAHGADPGDLAAQGEVLDRVGDTLGMLGLGVPRRVVTEQRQIIGDIASKTRSADETTLLDVAGALLYVEASLDDHIDRLGGEEPASEDAAVQMELPKAEVRKILDALMKEASVNIAQAKQDIVAFIESPWDHAKVEQIPRLLEEISGALRMLDLTEPAGLMTAIVRFVEVELLHHRRVPTVEQMDKLADALASIEYFMEATREQRGGRDHILDVTRSSLESLGYWPIPSDDDADGETVAATEQADSTAIHDAAESAPPAADEFSAALMAAGSGLSADGAEAHAAATRGEFLQWSDHVPADAEPEAPFEQSAGQDDGAHLPSIELTTDANVDDLIASFSRSEEAAAGSAPAAELELTHAVDIAPGMNLEDLVVGEAHAHEPVTHDLHGLALPETEPTAPPPVDETEQHAAVQAAPEAVRYVEVEEEIEEEVPDTEGSAVLPDASFHTSASDEIDAEIREVFVEEVQEEIENLSRQLPNWQADPNDFERLKPIRRSFHTLKGSGRLVGALALGEFSWKIENMLNRVLDRTIGPTNAVQALTGQAIAALPELLAGLRGEGAPRSDVGAIMSVADRLASGEDAWVRTGAPRRMKKVRRVVRRLVPVAVEPAQAPQPVVELPPMQEALTTFETPPQAEAAIDAFADEALPARSPLPNIDPVLYEIFTSEVASHLGVIDAFLAESRAVADGVPANEPLLRAVHTLNGAVAMVDVPVITQLLSPLESYIKRLCAGGLAPSEEGLGVLTDVAGVTRDVMAALERGDGHLPESGGLAHRIEALRDALPEPQMYPLFEAARDVGEAPGQTAEVTADAVEAAPVHAESEQIALDQVDPAWLAELAGIETVSLSSEEPPAPVVDEFASAVIIEDAAGSDALHDVASAADSGMDLTAMLVEQIDASPEVTEAEAQATIESANEADLGAEAAATEPEAVNEPVEASFDEASFAAETSVLSSEELASVVEPEAVEELATAQELTTAEEPTTVEESAPAEEAVIAFDTPIIEETPEQAPEVVAAPVGRVEPAYAPMLAASMAESLTEAPVLAEDVQPEGKLELAEMDEDLLEIFVQEGADILDHSDSLMAGLRAAPHDRELVGGLQRDLHTLKGGARMAGLAPIGDLSHAMESLLDAISENRRVMDRITVESLERGFDRLHGLVQRVAKRQAIAMPAHAIARFEGLVSGDLPVAEALPEPDAPVVAEAAGEETEEASIVAEAAAVAPPVRLPPRPLPRFEDEEIQPRAPQEMIRVRSDLLDSLVNYAGEVSIYRSRLEQQISTFRFNLVEFETTVSRLRDQLRKLELETEAQI